MRFGQFHYLCVHVLVTDGHICGELERFCFSLNNDRPLLPLETAFFETARAGKGLYCAIFQAPN